MLFYFLSIHAYRFGTVAASGKQNLTFLPHCIWQWVFVSLEVDLSSLTTRQKKLFKYLANQKDHARTKPSVWSCHQTPTLWMRRQYFDVCLYENVHSSYNEGVCFENEIASTADIRSQCWVQYPKFLYISVDSRSTDASPCKVVCVKQTLWLKNVRPSDLGRGFQINRGYSQRHVSFFRHMGLIYRTVTVFDNVLWVSQVIGHRATGNLHNVMRTHVHWRREFEVTIIGNAEWFDHSYAFVCLFLAQQTPVGQGLFIHEVSRSHTQRRTTAGGTPLDEWSARRRDLYMKTHNTHNRQTSSPPGGIRTHNLSRREGADLRLRPRGNWDRV